MLCKSPHHLLKERLSFALWLCLPCFFVSSTWDYVRSLPHFTYLFYSFRVSPSRRKPGIFPHASWNCCLQRYTTALSQIKYGLRQDQRLSVYIFPSGCKILPNGNTRFFLKWKSSPLALPLTLPRCVTKKGCKWVIILKLQLQILPVKLLRFLHH